MHNFFVYVQHALQLSFSVKEDDEAFADFKNATLRNKNALQTENNKLSCEVEKVRTEECCSTSIVLSENSGNYLTCVLILLSESKLS